MAVNIENLSILALGNGWLANGSAENLILDGSIVHGARTLLASANVTGGAMKLLRHASDACLAKISFAGAIEATLRAQGEISVEVRFLKTISRFHLTRARIFCPLNIVKKDVCFVEIVYWNNADRRFWRAWAL